MSAEGWIMLAVGMIACFAFAVSWAAWINSRKAKEDLSALRYRLRREIGSDGL